MNNIIEIHFKDGSVFDHCKYAVNHEISTLYYISTFFKGVLDEFVDHYNRLKYYVIYDNVTETFSMSLTLDCAIVTIIATNNTMASVKECTQEHYTALKYMDTYRVNRPIRVATVTNKKIMTTNDPFVKESDDKREEPKSLSREVAEWAVRYLPGVELRELPKAKEKSK